MLTAIFCLDWTFKGNSGSTELNVIWLTSYLTFRQMVCKTVIVDCVRKYTELCLMLVNNLLHVHPHQPPEKKLMTIAIHYKMWYQCRCLVLLVHISTYMNNTHGQFSLSDATPLLFRIFSHFHVTQGLYMSDSLWVIITTHDTREESIN